MATPREVLQVAATLGPPDGPTERVRRLRLLLGGMVQITVVGEREAAGSAADAALDAVEAVEQELSLYLPDSALCRLNRDGQLDHPPEGLRRCLQMALEVAQASNGAFDPTVQPVLALVAASFAAHNAPPDAAAIAAALVHVGHQRVQLGPTRVALEPGMALTLNGVAKGHAMDQARAALRARGATAILAAASGDVAVEGGPWKLALRDPHRPDQALERVWQPEPGGVGGSGGYMNVFSRDGAWHHITDPRTGLCPRHFAGVVVHATTALEADALSTALFVLPEAEALALADRRGVALLAFRQDGTEARSQEAVRQGLTGRT
jgi:thiamine biosynthesis lipoprotein